MAKSVELRRHTASDGDVLTPEGVTAALEIGRRLHGGYHMLVSSGAQRATQTLACFLSEMAERRPVGVTVDTSFRSDVEDRWVAAAQQAGGGGLEAFRRVDPQLVEAEARRFGDALRRLFDALPYDGHALVVGHSPMHEVAVLGLTGELVEPVSKGAGLLVTEAGDGFTVAAVD
jgi:broad specificity phosphatase PhoE